MSAKSAFDLLLEHTARLREAKRRQLARTIDELARARAREQLLVGYEADYGARARSRLSAGAPVPVAQNISRFLGKLGEAVVSQRGEVASREDATRAAQAEMRDADRRHRSLELLREREQARRRAAEARREQHQQDEHAARIRRTRGHFE